MADLDLRLLEPFVALAEELHFGRAASRVHLSQPALSQQIRRLERQLGVRLFDRDTRRVRLTPAGEAFLTGAREAVELTHQAAREARRAGSARTALRIGVDIDCPASVVSGLRSFGAARPDVELRLRIQQQDDVVSDLLAGRLDLAVGWTGPPPGVDGVGWRPLTSVELHGVVPVDDPLARGDRLPRAALTGRTAVMYAPSRETRPFYDFFLSCFAGADGHLPRVVHVPVLDDAQAAMLDVVEDHGGFTLCIAGALARSGRERVVGLPFDPPVAAEVVALWRGRRPPAVLEDLRRHVSGGR